MASKNKFNVSTLVSQFKGLDPNNPGAWPILPKMALTAATSIMILVAGYFVDWSGQLEELEIGRQTEVQLKDEYVKKYSQAINLDLYKAQLDEVNQLLGSMLRQLPNRSQMETLITDINNAGVGRNLQFELFKPAAQETKNEIYAELPISIKVLGKYHDIGAFVADIGQLSRIVTINDLNIVTTPVGTPSTTLSMDATAKTFRYLDEEELAQARAEKAKANKGKTSAN